MGSSSHANQVAGHNRRSRSFGSDEPVAPPVLSTALHNQRSTCTNHCIMSSNSLPEQLRAATRQLHHALNTQIVARLPLCLPPKAETPFKYAKGMIVFGQIYFAFESALAARLKSSTADPRICRIYRKLYFPQLLRTSRLRNDIDSIKSRLRRNQVEDIEILTEESAAFRQQIEISISANPHVLLCYAWTMYLALFNGGRWIRKLLVSADSGFWYGENLPLSFWELDRQEQDGCAESQLKDAFNGSFDEAASLLTREEQETSSRKLSDCSPSARRWCNSWIKNQLIPCPGLPSPVPQRRSSYHRPKRLYLRVWLEMLFDIASLRLIQY